LGVFGAAQGVRGEVRIKSFTADPKAIGAYGALTDAAGARVFAFESLRALKDEMLVARVKGVSTREAAQALNGVELFARREQLPPPGEDEFYYDDLVGLAAVTREGSRLGRVVALSNFGAGDILEIALEGGGETLVLPFTKAVAPEIDFAAGRIVIEPPREIEGEREE
jgi:16S rRNA processing protein RimM